MSIVQEYKDKIISSVSPPLLLLKEKALARWDELNNRDQTIVFFLALTLVIVMFLVLIYAPIVKGRADAHAALENSQQMQTWMSSVAPKLNVSADNSSGSRNMINEINTAAAALSLRLGRVQPEGPNRLRVSIQDSSFNSVMTWLHDLSKNNINTSSLTIDAESTPGLVSVKAVLSAN